jgi:hypothetical protein
VRVARKSYVRPLLFHAAYGVTEAQLNKLGVFNPTLNVDTLLFPDPLLLEDSSHREMKAAKATFEGYFDRVRRLVAGSKSNTDAPAKAAKALLRFPEIQGTCLGYGKDGIAGSGAGNDMAEQLFKTASEIIGLGIDDPDLFLAMGLFEDNFGPDMIGDMFTNVVFDHIAAFNKRIYKALGLRTEQFEIKLNSGKRLNGDFVLNVSFPAGRIPVILLPKDVLRDLPVAVDWRGVQEASETNREFRRGLNRSVAHLWSKKTLESKEKLRAWALSGRDAFGDLLDMVHGHDGKPYDFAGDKLGELVWRSVGQEIVSKYPLNIRPAATASAAELIRITEEILSQFCNLIEKRDLWRELYHNGKPRLEKSAQRIFYAVAVAYCAANGIDITPEADTGRGPVDFKFSTGFDRRVLVEIKLSTNSNLVKGFTKQLEVYNEAEAPIAGYYLVIDVGRLKAKKKSLDAAARDHKMSGSGLSTVRYVDGLPKQSASKVR